MQQHLESIDAAEALVSVRERQEDVIDAVLVPGWYWWLLAVMTAALGVIVDTQEPVAIAIGAALYATVSALTSVWFILGFSRRVRVHHELLGQRGALAIVGFVSLALGATFAVGFGLEAAGSGRPGTIACIVAGAILAIGGPLLMRHLRATMLQNRSGATL